VLPIPHLGDPRDQSLKEYIVTLKNFDDLDDFYTDMESVGGNLYIPNRVVECKERRPISRNTHYWLSYNEAAEIRKDPRVLSVNLNYKDQGVEIELHSFEQTSSYFTKTAQSDVNANHVNWGLLRSLVKTNIPNWGSDFSKVSKAASIISEYSGKNVDVVIIDEGTPYANTIEYRKNSNGTGYSRLVEYDWYKHYLELLGFISFEPYKHSLLERVHRHAAHTTGTTAGNRQGWARDSNIWNINFQDFQATDLVRMFHKNKPINPLTGLKNPTVVNNSWGYSGRINTYNISQVYYRGQFYNRPTEGWSTQQLLNLRLIPSTGFSLPVPVESTDIDMIEAMEEGVIVVASAGNSAAYMDLPGGPDYDNYIVYGNSSYYCHRGSSPGSAWGPTAGTRVICVGSLGRTSTGTEIDAEDYRSEFSNYGPRIDVYAPGYGIQSNYKSALGAVDPRWSSLGGDTEINRLLKLRGTSMSGPQITGILGCIAEKYPRMTQQEAREFISTMSPETLLSTNGGAADNKDAGFEYNPNSSKKIIHMPGTRVNAIDPNTAYLASQYNTVAYPELTALYRPNNGQVVPRKRTLYNRNSEKTFVLSSSSYNLNYNQSATITLNTTNVPNGTEVQYIISYDSLNNEIGKISPYSTYVMNRNPSDNYTGIIQGLKAFDPKPYTSYSLQTTSASAGTLSRIPNNLLGTTGLNAFPVMEGNDEMGYWQFSPFPIVFAGETHQTIYFHTNSYITFSEKPKSFFDAVSYSNGYVPGPKIIIDGNGNFRSPTGYAAVSGSAPNRIFRFRYEGITAYNITVPNLIWEATFYENIPNKIDIHIGQNAAQVDDYFPFIGEYVNVDRVGKFIVNSNTATLPITVNRFVPVQTKMNLRLGMYPTPEIDIQLNKFVI